MICNKNTVAQYSGLTNVGNTPHAAFYDKNKILISVFKHETGKVNLSKYDIPSKAAYVRFTVINANLSTFKYQILQ